MPLPALHPLPRGLLLVTLFPKHLGFTLAMGGPHHTMITGLICLSPLPLPRAQPKPQSAPTRGVCSVSCDSEQG